MFGSEFIELIEALMFDTLNISEPAFGKLLNTIKSRCLKLYCNNLRKCTACKIKPLKKAICELIELEIKLHKEIYEAREKEIFNKN